MSATVTQGQAERAELEAILNSGIFSRSPILATFLKYICERYFEGDTDGLKEYCIAVEALKRSQDFDQRKDAIVRVEAHRLRKRLADYYSKDGVDHPIHIEIPNGQYAPRFVYRESAVATVGAEPGTNQAPALEPQAIEPPVDASQPLPVDPLPAEISANGEAKHPRRFWFAAALLITLALAGCAIILLRANSGTKIQPKTEAKEVWDGPATPVPTDFRMLAGYHGAPFTDRQGRAWFADAYFTGGVSVPLPNHRAFKGLPDPEFAASQRVGDFSYSIPVNPGTYEVYLHFLETQDADGPRLFSVLLNGKLTLDHMDALSDAGAPHQLTSRVLADVTPAKDGRIHLTFQQMGTKPELVALEVLATTPGKVRPVRIVVSPHSVTDPQGVIWLADECSVGGTVVERPSIVGDSALKTIYVGERYGNFSYQIPLPPGKYRLKLFFAESYFSDKLPPGSKQGGFEARIFNVFADGVTLLRNFNVMKEAGGDHRPVVKTFNNLEPNAQGKIALQFVPVVNYAEVNALEVTQMDETKIP
jgi:hypothetical protein